MPKLLIVDDQPTIRNLLKDAFNAQGFDVEAKSDGKSGLEAALDGGYDAIMLDLKMPEMDGLNVLDQLKNPNQVNGPIVIFSSVTYPFAEPEALRRGAAGFINKDTTDPKEIVSIVLDLIKKHRGE